MKPPFDLLYEDNHLLVISKPAMLPTMGVGDDKPSLIREAKAYIKEKFVDNASPAQMTLLYYGTDSKTSGLPESFEKPVTAMGEVNSPPANVETSSRLR